jgi:hypothetical protein
MHSLLAGEIYAVAVLAGPVEDWGTCRAAAPVPTLPASCLLAPPRPPEPPLPPEPPPRPPEPPQPPPEPIPDPTRPPPPPPVRLGVLAQSSIFGQNPKIECQEFNDLQTLKLSKKQLCDRTRPLPLWRPSRPRTGAFLRAALETQEERCKRSASPFLRTKGRRW